MKYRLFRILLVLIISCISSSLFAGNTGKLAGTVTDDRTGEALAGANIIIESSWRNDTELPLDFPLGASTDLEGTYFILNLRPGLYSVRVSYIGYREQIKTRVEISVDKTTRLDYKLTEQLLETEEILVTAYFQETVEKDLTATKQVYNISDVQSIAGVQSISEILELQADVVDDHFRGGRLGEASYLLGGAAIVNPLNNNRAFNPIVTGLEQVEVYTSGFSAEYGNAQSGVVNMVTKEGAVVWETRAEVSSTLPYYKSWNGSPYSLSNLKFTELLADNEEWLRENPLLPGRPLWDRGYGVTKYLPPRDVWPPDPLNHQDSLKMADLGRILWLQSVRDLGLEYANTMDYRVDLTTGGRIAKNAQIFMAFRQNLVNPIIPTPQPDLERQIMANLTYAPTPASKYKLSFLTDYSFENYLNSNYERWLFDRTFSVLKRIYTSSQYGLEFKHVFSPSTFGEIVTNILKVQQQDRIDLLEEGQLLEDYSNNRNWVDYTGPSNHRVARLSDDRGDRNTTTYYFGSSLTSQVDRYNLLKSGIQFYYYNLNVDYEANVSNPGTIAFQRFQSFPYEGAVYFQDKMEYEGLIANIGLRFDFYHLKTKYFLDKFNPLLDPEAVKNTDIFTRLQPRLGFSFPVSEMTVFHLNYGTFTQRPNFNQLYFNEVNEVDNVLQIITLGNPQLKPENTNAYDIGIVHQLSRDFKVDVSAYYKDVKDLVQTALYVSRSGEAYESFINLDYADIKGFHFSLEKRSGSFRGYIRYNFESATGKSGNPDNLNVAPIFSESDAADGATLSERFPEDVLLDYDRTHKAVINLRYLTERKSGPEIAGFYPFADISVDSTYRVSSGRPYTFDESGQSLKFNRRALDEHEWRLRLEKSFTWTGTRMTGYFEVFNLLNEKNWHYSRTLTDDRNVIRWQEASNKNDILVEDEFAPYVTRQDIHLLRNQPRHYRVGLIFKF